MPFYIPTRFDAAIGARPHGAIIGGGRIRKLRRSKISGKPEYDFQITSIINSRAVRRCLETRYNGQDVPGLPVRPCPPMTTLLDLAQKWRALAAQQRQLGAEAQAAVLEYCAEELEASWGRFEAEESSRYSFGGQP